jgi:hypothetical protein
MRSTMGTAVAVSSTVLAGLAVFAAPAQAATSSADGSVKAAGFYVAGKDPSQIINDSCKGRGIKPRWCSSAGKPE